MMKLLRAISVAASFLPVLVGGNTASDVLIADFEGDDYAAWLIEGNAFGTGPAQGKIGGQQEVTGFKGNGLVNTFLGGDAPTGTLTSLPFEVSRDYLTFLIGGGKHPGRTGLELLVDGKTVRSATGQDNERLEWRSWDVRPFAGRQARLRIVDHESGGFGHINIDHILLTSRPKGTTPGTGTGSRPRTWLTAATGGGPGRSMKAIR